MSKYRISVYAIAKNEEKFARRWAESMSEADEIIVLDTGSSDNTVSILSDFEKVKVYSREIVPWRFDTARNISLSLVSQDTDYCVCTDLDEVFTPGWRQALENTLDKAADKYPHKISYRYTWSFNEDGSENTVFNIEKIHRRRGFLWTHPVHEVLSFYEEGTPRSVFAPGIQLNHYPDNTKSRQQYLPLLELSVKESPEDDRNMHYLGREYMFHKRYDEAISTLKKHLSLKTALWPEERCASMRYIAKCFIEKGNNDEALLWLMKAAAEAGNTREPWIDTARLLYSLQNWYGVIFFTEKALEIKESGGSYITDKACYGALPHDLLSIAYYHIKNYGEAKKNAQAALVYSPEDDRIKNNLSLFESLTG